MKTLSIAILSSLAVGALAIVQLQKRPADEQVEGRYKLGGLTAELLGACRITESAVDCWDMKGQPSPEISKLVDATLRKISSQDYDRPLAFSYGKKNRYLVRQIVREGDYSASVNWEYTGQRSPIDLLHESQNIGNWRQERTVQLVPIVMAEDGTTGSSRMTTTEMAAMANPVMLPIRVGAEARVEGTIVRITGFTKVVPDPRTAQFSPPGDSWNIELAIEPAPSRRPTVSLWINSEKTGSTLYVDKKGKIVTNEEVMKQRGQEGNRFYSGPMIQSDFRPINGFSMQAVQSPTKANWIVPIQPSKLPSARLSLSYEKIIEITGAPLDPR